MECNNDIFLRIVILKYHRGVLFQVRQYVTPFTCRIVECFFGCLLDSTVFVLSSGQVQDFWGRWWFRMSVLEPVLAGENWCLLVNWWNGSMNQPYQLELQYEMVASISLYWLCILANEDKSGTLDMFFICPIQLMLCIGFFEKLYLKQRREGLRWKPSWEGILLESELLSVGNRTLVRHILASQSEAGREESAGKEDLVEFDSFQLCEGKSYSWIKC